MTRKVYRGRDIPDEGDADALADVVERCPSGALQYRRLDGGPQEQSASPTTVVPLRTGPLLVRGDVGVRHADGTTERLPCATLCRCGLSGNKPFCDNSHLGGTFEAPGDRIRVRVSAVRRAPNEPITRADDPRRDR